VVDIVRVPLLPVPDFRASAELLSAGHLRHNLRSCYSTFFHIARVRSLNTEHDPRCWNRDMRAAANRALSRPEVVLWYDCQAALREYWAELESVARLRVLPSGYARLSKMVVPPRWVRGAVHPPSWLGDPKLHASHRAWLLYDEPTQYAAHGWPEQPSTELWWPPGISLVAAQAARATPRRSK